MRTAIKRAGENSSSYVRLNVKREAYTGTRNFTYMAVLSPRQLRKIEKSCGSMPSQWVLADGCTLFFGVYNELSMLITAFHPETWAICWKKGK